MFSFVQNLFSSKTNPIGVDFGSDQLRMAQVQPLGEEFKLIAAASIDVPAHVRLEPSARLNFFAEAARDLIAQGGFRGRQAVLGLPAWSMFIQHLRMPKLEPEALKKALQWELRGKLPIDPSHALLRHLIAGEIYHEQDPKDEVVVVAAAREMVNQFLSSAAKAKLDVVGMNVEPKALVDCFSHIYRRKRDEGATSCFVDIGCVASRVVIARDGRILFARVIPVGGDHFSRAVASKLGITLENAKLLRVKLAVSQPKEEEPEETAPAPVTVRDVNPEASIENSFALLAAGLPPERRKTESETAAAVATAPETATERMTAPVPAKADEAPSDETEAVMAACQDPLTRLVEELELCRRYYETTFQNKPVERLIFVGGEARQKMLCQHIAKEMRLAAQVGDPLVRMNRTSEVGIECGIDRRVPQPAWAVAIGLSMGPATLSEPAQ
jgi:type IV pilus assembly protein PilM